MLPKKDMTKTDIVFVFVVALLMGAFSIGNALVTKQIVQLKRIQAEYVERRDNLCIEYKAMNIVFKFRDGQRKMFVYCWPDIMEKEY